MIIYHGLDGNVRLYSFFRTQPGYLCVYLGQFGFKIRGYGSVIKYHLTVIHDHLTNLNGDGRIF